MGNLDAKNAYLTDSDRSIGRAVALKLAQTLANMVPLGRSRTLEEAAETFI